MMIQEQRRNRITMKILQVSIVICFVLLAQSSLTAADGRKPRLRYMTNHCSDYIQVTSSLQVALTPVTSLQEVRDAVHEQNLHCKVTMKTDQGSRLLVHFLQLGISPNQVHHDRVKIFDGGFTRTELTPPPGLYGNLDRALLTSDREGSKVKDYRSSGNEIVIDYTGVPTLKHRGFTILVTVLKDPESTLRCEYGYFRCPVMPWCIPVEAVCDGFTNCGLHDPGDEKSCDSFKMETDLLEKYSLAYDIIVMSVLPISMFALILLAAYCFQRQYIRLKIEVRTETPVVYTSFNGGQAKLKLRDDEQQARLYAPPSYEDIMPSSHNEGGAKMQAPPPAYSTLAELVRSGEVEMVDSEDEIHHTSPQRRRQRERQRKQTRRYRDSDMYDSLSSVDDVRASPRAQCKIDKGQSRVPQHNGHNAYPGHHPGHHRRPQDNLPPVCSDTDDESEARARRNRSKGGKGKKTVCLKRRADDLVSNVPGDKCKENMKSVTFEECSENNVDCHDRQNECTIQVNNDLPTTSPSTSSLPSYEVAAKFNQPSLQNGHHPHVYISTENTSFGPIYQNTNGHSHSEGPPPHIDKLSHPKGYTKPTSVPYKEIATSKSSEATVCSGPSPSPSTDSSADPAGQSGTESRSPSHANSRTESNVSLADSHLLPDTPAPKITFHLDSSLETTTTSG